MLGYADIWITVVSIESVSPTAARLCAEWHQFRAQVATTPGAAQIATQLRCYKEHFQYPEWKDDRDGSKIEMKLKYKPQHSNRPSNLKSEIRSVSSVIEQMTQRLQLITGSRSVSCDTERGLCVCCLDARAVMVMLSCGLLVYCASCQRQAISLARNVAQPASLTKRQLMKWKVECPICRKASCIVHKDNFVGTTYVQ